VNKKAINYLFNQNNINKWRKNKVLWIILDISFENKWKDYKKNTTERQKFLYKNMNNVYKIK